MERDREPSGKHAAFQATVAVAVCVLFLAAYVAAMRALLDLSDVADGADIDRRDTVYAYVHLGLVLIAAVVGFVVGKWLNGLGLAYALFFVIMLLIGMVATQGVTYELACHGHNGLIRHWQC